MGRNSVAFYQHRADRRGLHGTEAIQRAAVIAEAEGSTKIEPTHLERVLPQLLLDF